MGHYAKFEGSLTLSPTLSTEHRSELDAYLQAQYAPWRVAGDGGRLLAPIEGTPQPYDRSLRALITTYLAPWGYRADGTILWEGEEPGDTGMQQVTSNTIALLPDEEEALGEAGIEDILGLLRSRDPESIRRASEIIGYYGEPIPGAIDALLVHLNDPVMEVRWRAIECMSELEEQAGPAVPALIAALTDAHEWVRSAAAATLGAMGPHAAAAIPALERLLNDPSYGPRGRAQQALPLVRGSQTQ